MTLPLPRMLADRYRLLSCIGQGGMGQVYRALDTAIRREVAVKLIVPDPASGPDSVERFLREAKNTARISHPNIVEVFDFGRGPEGLFFVMELLDGESLADCVIREQRLPIARVLKIAIQLCQGLAHAHGLGVIHRDLKPANIMLLDRGEEDFVKILDFGVAKVEGQGTQLTKTGVLIGTVEYMAPEQILGRPIDARTDIYALGALLYRLLSGAHVFPGPSAPAIIHAQVSKQPESLRSRMQNQEFPIELDQIVLRCLAKAPEHRFDDMSDLEQALTSLQDALFADDPYPSWERTQVNRDQAPEDGQVAKPPAVKVTSAPRSVSQGAALAVPQVAAAAAGNPAAPAEPARRQEETRVERGSHSAPVPLVSAPPVSAPPVSAPPATGAPSSGASSSARSGAQGAAAVSAAPAHALHGFAQGVSSSSNPSSFALPASSLPSGASAGYIGGYLGAPTTVESPAEPPARRAKVPLLHGALAMVIGIAGLLFCMTQGLALESLLGAVLTVASVTGILLLAYRRIGGTVIPSRS
jgi:eukaryotic-like serine/threonine-protein kinase